MLKDEHDIDSSLDTYDVHKVRLRIAARLVKLVRRDVHHGGYVTVVGTARRKFSIHLYFNLFKFKIFIL